jgi:hypothetical protein
MPNITEEPGTLNLSYPCKDLGSSTPRLRPMPETFEVSQLPTQVLSTYNNEVAKQTVWKMTTTETPMRRLE